MNAIPASAIAAINNDKTDLGTKKALYARYLYRHWVERQSRVRCQLYDDCLTRDKTQKYWDTIVESFSDSQGDRLLEAKSINSSTVEVTIAKCAAVKVTNWRSADFRNYFDLLPADPNNGEPIKDHPGQSNVDRMIAFKPVEQKWTIGARYCPGFREGSSCLPMVHNSIHYGTGITTTDVWFQDPGSSFSSPNLVVRFWAELAPGVECRRIAADSQDQWLRPANSAPANCSR
jgi:hypothetical protein